MFDQSPIKPFLLSNASGNSGLCHPPKNKISLTANIKDEKRMLSTECLIKSWLLQCDSAFSKTKTPGTDFEFPPCKPVHHRGRTVSSPSLLTLPVEQENNTDDPILSNQGKLRFPAVRPFSAKTDAINNPITKNKSIPPRLPKCVKAPIIIQSDASKSNTTLENTPSATLHENVAATSVVLTRAQQKKSLNGRSGALQSKADEGLSTSSANDWYSMTSSDWADEVCEFDKEESYRVQQMFDAIDTILYETDDMLLVESKFRTQKSNKHSTSPVGSKVSKVSQYLGQNNGVPLDPAIKELSCAPYKQMTTFQGNARQIQMFPGVEHLLSECKEWAEKFPHLRIRGAGIKKAERTSTVAKKAITFTPGTSSKANIGKVTMPEIPDVQRSGYVVEGSEICKPLTNGAFTHQIPQSLNTPNYMPHLLVRGQQLSPRVPQTLPGMHLTTWSQYPRRIVSGRHSAPKSTRLSVPQPAKVRNLLTDDLAIARVGSCPYAADTTMTAKLTRRILSTPDPRSRNLNLLTRIKTETSRLSGRSRLSPVESTSPGPRTPAEGTRNWRAGDQLSPYLKTSRVKSEQNTRKLCLARSVQKLSELASDCPPQYAVHINTVSDSSAVLKEEILAILYADVAAAVFAVASGSADHFQTYLRSITDAHQMSGKQENPTSWSHARLSDSPNDEMSQCRAEDEKAEALPLNRTKLYSPIPDFSTLGSALNISSKTLQQRTSGTEVLSSRLNLSDLPRQQTEGEDSLNRKSSPSGRLNIPNIQVKSSRQQQRSRRRTMTQKGNITLPTECSNQPRLAHAHTLPITSCSGRLVPTESASGTLPALSMHQTNENSSAFQVVSFRWRLNSKQPAARVLPMPENQLLSTSQPNLAGGDSFHRTQLLPPIVLNPNLSHCSSGEGSKGVSVSWTDSHGDLPQEDRPNGLGGKAQACRGAGAGGIKRVSSSLFPAGGLPAISSSVSSNVVGPDSLPANSKAGLHRSVTKFPEFASAVAVQHCTTLPPTALAAQKMPVTALQAVSVHKHWDQFSSSSKSDNGLGFQCSRSQSATSSTPT